MNAVGIDVSKEKSTVTIRQPGDVILLHPRDYNNAKFLCCMDIFQMRRTVGRARR